MNPTILGVIGPGFLNQVPTLVFIVVPVVALTNCIFRILNAKPSKERLATWFPKVCLAQCAFAQ